MRPLLILATVGLMPLVGGCVAHAAWDVATLPVKAGAKAVDWTTTSPSEADRSYARKMRKQQEREDRARRDAAKACRKHPDACPR